MVGGAGLAVALCLASGVALPLLGGRWLLARLQTEYNNDFYPWLLGVGVLSVAAYVLANLSLIRLTRQWRSFSFLLRRGISVGRGWCGGRCGGTITSSFPPPL